MARKKRDSGGGYSWMDTYGDMVTLLLTFFIMLFSMSSVNEEKWEVLIRAFTKNPDAATAQIILVQEGDGEDVAPSVGVSNNIGDKASDDDLPTELSQLYEYIMSFIAENQLDASVSVSTDSSNNVYIRFDNNIFFDGDSATLRNESKPILDFLGDCLKSVEDDIFITRVNGHTAAIPGAEDYHVSDWQLSGDRASQVVIYLEEHKGLNPKKLMCNGYGKNYPIESNDTPEGRAANRRVEVMILGNNFDRNNADDLYSMLKNVLTASLFEDEKNNTDTVLHDTNRGSPSLVGLTEEQMQQIQEVINNDE